MDDDAIEVAKANAKILHHAAKVLDSMSETQAEMVADGEVPDDAESADLKDELEAASDTCTKISMSLTMMLTKEGVTVDFDKTDDDDGPAGPSGFA